MGTIVTNTGIETANRKTVKEILGSKFIVPEYQRPYSWTETEVLQLLEDIWQHFIRSHNDKNKSDKTVHEMYFLGSILTAKDTTEDGRLCLVDGQQRITTLLCVVSALADVIRSNQKTENENKVWAKIPVDILDKLLADRDYNGVPTPRISYNREAIDNFFKNFIADNSNVKINKHGEKPDHEVKLLSQAYTTAKDFLNDKLKAELVVDFLEFFDNKIQVVLIEVASMQYAVLAYETMNSRGLPLTALEQLKGVLFRSFAGTELLLYEEAVKVWQQILKRFYAINEASSQWVPIRGEHSVSSDKKILGAFISVYEAISPGQFNVKTLMSPGTPELSKWVIKEHEFTGTGRKEAKAAKEALDILNRVSTVFLDMLEGKIDGVESPALIQIRKSGLERTDMLSTFIYLIVYGEKFINLSKEDRETLLEEYLKERFVASLTLERANNKKVVQKIHNRLKTYFNKDFAALMENLKEIRREHGIREKFKDAVQNQQYNAQYVAKLKYFLGYLERSWFKGQNARQSGVDTTPQHVDLEHISPSNAGHDFAKLIGNLTLLEVLPNRGNKDIPPSEKTKSYSISKFILTRALCEPEANSRFKGYPTVNDPKNPWGEISVKTRGEILAELACQAFDLN